VQKFLLLLDNEWQENKMKEKTLKLAGVIIFVCLAVMFITACEQSLSGTWVGVNPENNSVETLIFKDNTVELTNVDGRNNYRTELKGTFAIDKDYIIITPFEINGWHNEQEVDSQAQHLIGAPMTLSFTQSGDVITINDINYSKQR